MKTEPTFKQLAIAFVAAGSPGASERERREAEALAGYLPFQWRTEGMALKMIVRDDETAEVVDMIRRWSLKPGLVSVAAQRSVPAA